MALFGLEDLEVAVKRTVASGEELSCPTLALHIVHKGIKLSELKGFFLQIFMNSNCNVLFFPQIFACFLDFASFK